MNSPLRDALEGAKIKWYLPADDVSQHVLNPGLKASDRFDCMSGYFSATVLRELSAGIAGYLHGSENTLRLLISSDVSNEDRIALENGIGYDEMAEKILSSAFESEEALASALVNHTKTCLAYLIANNRLEIRVVFVEQGIFHPKIWLMYQGDDVAVLSGSANATGSGLSRNVEQLTLQCSWKGQDSHEACIDDSEFFNSYWNNLQPGAIVWDLPKVIANRLLKPYSSQHIPTEDSYLEALALEKLSVETAFHNGLTQFEIPSYLVWETGNYRHQGEAVKAWEDNQRCGILAMATGAGKTITSLIAARRLLDEVGDLLIIVGVPTKLLLNQWAQDLGAFGLHPYLPLVGTADDHLREIDYLIQSLELGVSHVESAVITLNLLKNPKLVELLSAYKGNVLLIADEMHNLGSDAFTNNPPDVKYRLGLSATPERQYDPDGTQSLFAYFGKVVYEFSLDDAIGVCLVPYNYSLHQVRLTHDEHSEYARLSEQIRKLYAYRSDSEDESRIQRLLEKRRLVLEAAEEKLDSLRSSLLLIGPRNVKHTLIYCTDKNPEQLKDVNALLHELDIKFHQVTDEESSNPKLLSRVIAEFRRGNLQVLTAKRILDEGFNMPEISTAFILASTTVERQWTQRRGRVLRMCDSIGKEFANIHDFIALPPVDVTGDPDAKNIVEAEIVRVKEFARLALDRSARGGANEQLDQLTSEYIIWTESK